MGDTYCGKLCEDCQFKDNLQCPGCKTGPGKTWMTECELAKCCMDKGHHVVSYGGGITSQKEGWREDHMSKKSKRR